MLAVDTISAEVFFVDYGDTEWIPKISVQPIHPSLLQVSMNGMNILTVRCS